MLGKLLPVILAVAGIGAGLGAGFALRPPPAEPMICGEEGAPPCPENAGAGTTAGPSPTEGNDEGEDGLEYVRMDNQFVVPIVRGGTVGAMVVMSLTVEVEAGTTDAVFAREPRLRDAFLAVLFDHAHTGGFDGDFTLSENLAVLRQALRETARKTVGPQVRDVLIVDITRQDT